MQTPTLDDSCRAVSWSISARPRIAYFSMEIGLHSEMPTYSGGLGVLSGDTIRAAADVGVPMVAVTLLHRKGYFRQVVDSEGRQTEQTVSWTPERFARPVEARVQVPIEGRRVEVRAWRFDVTGVGGKSVPVYLLDTDLDANSVWDRRLTDSLYGGDHHYRLCQETLLGIAGLRMLREIYGRDAADPFTCFHMNEGHASLLPVELLSEHIVREGKSEIDEDAVRFVRNRCVFTTHTPIAAGHDRFPIDHVRHVVGDHPVFHRPDLYGDGNGSQVLNTTRLALNLTRYANGVARKHGEVSREMFPGTKIDSITNGVHPATWVSPAMSELFDRAMPEWRRDSADLRLAAGIDGALIRSAHRRAKQELLRVVAEEARFGDGKAWSADVLTIGFARRATAYKRPDLLLSEPARLVEIAERTGPIQVVYAGKAHPGDTAGKESIARIHDAAVALRSERAPVRVAFLPNYTMDLGRLITSGVDLWLNNPVPPLEASGTSGMKAALNGVPSLSVLDGWWIEGCIEGVTGWAIGRADDGGDEAAVARHADALFEKLGGVVAPLYAGDPEGWARVMRSAIAINGPQFCTHRMVRDYVMRAYS